MEKATFTVHELAEYLNIGLNNAYKLVRDGEIHWVKIKQFRIPKICVSRMANNW